MSYRQIFRRIGRILKSETNSMLHDTDKDAENAFDEELRKAEAAASGKRATDGESASEKRSTSEGRQREEQAHSSQQGTRKPGEKDDAYYYAILGLTPDASEAEIKKSYRKLMAQYHPDRVATLGPELQKTAMEKTQAINEAYMIIERRRGMK